MKPSRVIPRPLAALCGFVLAASLQPAALAGDAVRAAEAERLDGPQCLDATRAIAAPAGDTPLVLWTWAFNPPSSVNDNVATVLGAPDLDGDGYPDALAACEDYTVRALSGHSVGTPTLIWTFGGTDEMPESDKALALYPDRDGDGKPEIVFATGGKGPLGHFRR